MDIQFSTATRQNSEKIFNLINLAYEVENGDTGASFKNQPRLLDHFDTGMDESYDNG